MIHIEDNHNIGYSKITLTGDTLNYLIDIIRWLETNEVPLLNSSNGKITQFKSTPLLLTWNIV